MLEKYTVHKFCFQISVLLNYLYSLKIFQRFSTANTVCYLQIFLFELCHIIVYYNTGRTCLGLS